jgi:hypothetical protein
MAILLANFVWEGLSTEPRPTVEQGAGDGHILKELDTGESYIRVLGEWKFINLGLSYIKATKSGIVTTDANGIYDVVFNTPFINSEYSLQLTCEDAGAVKPAMAFFTNVTKNGFRIQSRDSKKGDPQGSVVVAWLATRNYNP